MTVDKGSPRSLRLLTEYRVCIDGRKEKPQRASLFTAMQRALTKDTIVIIDGLNYIKGYRYQMYCVARELSVRVATVSSTTCAIGHCEMGPSNEELMFTTSSSSSLPHRNYAANGMRNAPRSRHTRLRREFNQDSPVPRFPSSCGATGLTTSFNGSKSRRQWSDGIRHCLQCLGTRNCPSVTSGKLLQPI